MTDMSKFTQELLRQRGDESIKPYIDIIDA